VVDRMNDRRPSRDGCGGRPYNCIVQKLAAAQEDFQVAFIAGAERLLAKRTS
jgi:hypothetical protein